MHLIGKRERASQQTGTETPANVVGAQTEQAKHFLALRGRHGFGKRNDDSDAAAQIRQFDIKIVARLAGEPRLDTLQGIGGMLVCHLTAQNIFWYFRILCKFARRKSSALDSATNT
jgi:hypothetical protein